MPAVDINWLQAFRRRTTKFWVRTSDVSAVKRIIIENMPVFVFNKVRKHTTRPVFGFDKVGGQWRRLLVKASGMCSGVEAGRTMLCNVSVLCDKLRVRAQGCQ